MEYLMKIFGRVLVAAIFFLSSVSITAADTIKIPTHNWSSQLVGAEVVGMLLEKVGEKVEYINMDSQAVYQAMADGDIDLVHEIWEGAFGASYEKAKAGGGIEEILTHKDLLDILDSPQIPRSSKVHVIGELLGNSVSELAINLITLLALDNIAHIIKNIKLDFLKLLDEHRGITRGTLISAVSMNPSLTSKIGQLLSDRIGNPVELTAQINPAIIGGFLAKIGDKVIDGSIKTKLSEMRRQIIKQV